MADNENVARLLKSVWICDGMISSAAFNLRPQIRETYISVLRENADTFNADVKKVCKKLPVSYALMKTEGIRNLKTENLEDDIKFDVKAVDNENIKSHAGIFITINGQKLVGGEPFESLEIKRGTSADCVLLEIRKTIARFANKKILQFNG